MSNELAGQLFVGKWKPVESKFKKITNRPLFMKPWGGLWTSTYDERLGSDWIQWCNNNEPGWQEKTRWHLLPRPDIKVLTIDSWSDFTRLCDIGYTVKNPHKEILSGEGLLDYEKLSLEYDAIHLTAKGERATRHVLFGLGKEDSYQKYGMFGLYGWDCESTLWLKWSFLQVKKLPYQEYNLADVVE